MNVYLITEDSESFCIRAENMAEAINVCEQSYLEDQKDFRGKDGDYNETLERTYYHNEVLQSCALVGELKN